MDILNFIYWIKNRRVITSAPDDSLLAIGVKDPRRDDRYLTCAIKASDLGVGGGGGDTTGQYRLSQFPETVIPRTEFRNAPIGEAYTLSGEVLFNLGYVEKLEDGTPVQLYYCQSILESGILIYEAYELLLDPLPEYISGWWIAYKQDPNDPEKLIKVGELKMTQQFWDKWYDYTAKDSGPNVVKFVAPSYPFAGTQGVESHITKLTWTGSALVAEDIYLDFDGATVLSLYTSFTGFPPISFNPEYRMAEYILDDDYYGMAMGTEAGWCWYRNTLPDLPGEEWILVGFNILTGETKWTNIVFALPSITNFNPDPLQPYEKCPLLWYNHPDGITVSLDDGKAPDNGDNLNGVTALWSPYWQDNTICLHIILRNQNSSPYGQYLNVNGRTGRSFYWDNKAFYFFTESNRGYNEVYIMHKYHVDTKETTSYTIPYIQQQQFGTTDIFSVFTQLWANNNGVFIYPNNFNLDPSFSLSVYQYVKHEDSKLYKFHLDPMYPSHAFGDKIYNINTYASYILDTLGLTISTYKNMTF